ncbi:MAG: glycosyltransferase [Verrucomicrobia bacterium]|nr:glycosyltransferase [Verrucomicrobiota bacterium]
MHVPLVSVVIPVYNEEDNIVDCLRSIRTQTLAAQDVEILLIDDDSTDRTRERAAPFEARIVRNGAKDCEVGKAIGIGHARGRSILFMDADNRLDDDDWLARALALLDKDATIAGVQSWKFRYDHTHNAAIRYHALWGNTDPLVFYLGGQDHLRQYETAWTLGGEIVEDQPEYVRVRFSARRLPTIGSQGFLTRREFFKEQMETFHHTEFFIHVIDRAPETTFAFLKCTVTHLAFDSVRDLRRMFSRNIRDYLRDSGKYPVRRYDLSPWRMLRLLAITQTGIIPLWDAWQGYRRVPDRAWFLHAYLAFVVPWTYARRIWESRARAVVMRRALRLPD